MGDGDGQVTIAFVRGYMRSGTSWVRNLLNLHPRVVCFEEMNLGVVRNAVNRITTELPWCEGARDEGIRIELWAGFHDMIERTMLRLASRKDGARAVVDCTPTHLIPLLPGSPMVWIVRDPRDVLVSWTVHAMRHEISYPDPGQWPTRGAMLERFRQDPTWFVERPGELLQDEAWVRFILGDWSKRYRRDLAQLDKIAGEHEVLRLRYEALHADTAGAQRAMYKLLGVDPAQAPAPSAATSTSAGRTGSENPLSHKRKGVVGDWQRHADERVRAVMKACVGEDLIHAGYENDTDW